MKNQLQIPENLGQIEHLRGHLPILERLVELSEAKSLEPFIEDYTADRSLGGFNWEDSPENNRFWSEVLGASENTAPFYEKYPQGETVRIPLKSVEGSAKYTGKPSEELIDAVNSMAEKAYNQVSEQQSGETESEKREYGSFKHGDLVNYDGIIGKWDEAAKAIINDDVYMVLTRKSLAFKVSEHLKEIQEKEEQFFYCTKPSDIPCHKQCDLCAKFDTPSKTEKSEKETEEESKPETNLSESVEEAISQIIKKQNRKENEGWFDEGNMYEALIEMAKWQASQSKTEASQSRERELVEVLEIINKCDTSLEKFEKVIKYMTEIEHNDYAENSLKEVSATIQTVRNGIKDFLSNQQP